MVFGVQGLGLLLPGASSRLEYTAITTLANLFKGLVCLCVGVRYVLSLVFGLRCYGLSGGKRNERGMATTAVGILGAVPTAHGRLC